MIHELADGYDGDCIVGAELEKMVIAADDGVCPTCDGAFQNAVVIGVLVDDGEVRDCADYVAEFFQVTSDLVGVGAWKLELASQLFAEFVEECG